MTNICTITDSEHLWGHLHALDVDDILECADLEVISTLLCMLAEGACPNTCGLLGLVVLSLHSFNGDDPAIEYWQETSNRWFNEDGSDAQFPRGQVSPVKLLG